MGVSTRHRWTVTLVLSAIAATPALCPYPARAAQARCASQELPPAEKSEAFGLVRQVIPQDAGRVRLEAACWNSDFAVAQFRTSTVVDPDGVHWWWSALCQRTTHPWLCQAATKERRIDVNVTEFGRSARIVTTLPVDFPADRARSITATSATLAGRRDMPLPACTPGPDDASNWNRLRSYVSTLASQDVYAEIERTVTGADVEYQDSMRFRFDRNGQAICWGQVVIVG
jgi:hypothetical protein